MGDTPYILVEQVSRLSALALCEPGQGSFGKGLYLFLARLFVKQGACNGCPPLFLPTWPRLACTIGGAAFVRFKMGRVFENYLIFLFIGALLERGPSDVKFCYDSW